MEKICISEEIGRFLRLMEQCQKNYEWATQEEIRQEKLSQDYLHLLELSDLSYHDRAKVAMKLKECRMNRRVAKDTAAILGCVTEFLNNERGKMLTGQLQQVLGKVRKAEKYIDQRSYTPKILSQEDFEMYR